MEQSSAKIRESPPAHGSSKGVSESHSSITVLPSEEIPPRWLYTQLIQSRHQRLREQCCELTETDEFATTLKTTKQTELRRQSGSRFEAKEFSNSHSGLSSVAEHPLSISTYIFLPFEAISSWLESLYMTAYAYWTAVRVAFAHVLTWESVVVSIAASGAVLLYWFIEPDGKQLVSKLSMGFSNFFIIFPITANIGYAFHRREKALSAIMGVKTYVFMIFMAHRDWGWKGDSLQRSCRIGFHAVPSNKTYTFEDDDIRSSLLEIEGGVYAKEHSHQVRMILMSMTRAMSAYLRVPLRGYREANSRNRNVNGVEDGSPKQKRLLPMIYNAMQKLTLAVEALKEAGLSATEAARISQYHSLMMLKWEEARYIKAYRTPHGLRAFARLYILIHPFFVGPYYVWVAGVGQSTLSSDEQSKIWPFQTNIGFAIALAVFTSITIQGLYNIEISLEDPFDEDEGLDDVRVRNTFHEMERIIDNQWEPGVWANTVTEGASLFHDARLEYISQPHSQHTVNHSFDHSHDIHTASRPFRNVPHSV